MASSETAASSAPVAPAPALQFPDSSPPALADKLLAQWAWAQDAYASVNQSTALRENVVTTRSRIQVSEPA